MDTHRIHSQIAQPQTEASQSLLMLHSSINPPQIGMLTGRIRRYLSPPPKKGKAAIVIQVRTTELTNCHLYKDRDIADFYK